MSGRLSNERLAELRHRRCGCHYTKPHLCDGCAIRALVDELRERRAGGPVRQIGSLDPGTRFKFRGQSGEALRLDTQDPHGRVGYTYLDMGEVQFCVPDLDVLQLDESEWA